MLAQKLGLSLPSLKKAGGGAAFENLYSLEFGTGSGGGAIDVLVVPDSDDLTPNGSGANRGWSVSFWMKTSNTRDSILGKMNGNPEAEYEFLLGRFGDLEVNLFTNTTSNKLKFGVNPSTKNMADGNWHHVLFSWDLSTSGTSGAILWIDGVEYSVAAGNVTLNYSGTFTGVVNKAIDLSIGFVNGINGSIQYEGFLDEIAFIDNVSTQSKATEYYNGGTPTDLSGETYLEAYWRNGDTAGPSVFPTIEDFSSNSNDGTMTNMASSDIKTDVP